MVCHSVDDGGSGVRACSSLHRKGCSVVQERKWKRGCALTTRLSGPKNIVGRVFPRHGQRGRPLNWVVRGHFGAIAPRERPGWRGLGSNKEIHLAGGGDFSKGCLRQCSKLLDVRGCCRCRRGVK